MARLKPVGRGNRRRSRPYSANPVPAVDVTARRDIFQQLEGKLADVPWRAGNTWRHVRGVIAYTDDREVGLISVDRHRIFLPLSVVGRPLEVWEE